MTQVFEGAIDDALGQLLTLVERFQTTFPDDCTVDGRYPLRPDPQGAGANVGWTSGFWTGMLWLADVLRPNETWRAIADANVASFAQRIEAGIDVDHHDLGFLYTLACAPAWQLHGDETARKATLKAAKKLYSRYSTSSGIIQSWGPLGDPEQRGRAIIDSLMNLPLLHWASEQTGAPEYAQAACTHATKLARRIIRDDDSTFHTFYWDEDGNPLKGATAQGLDDDSCWARGQAWGIYGFALNYRHTKNPALLDASIRCAEYFLSHQPKDRVAYWDLAFTDGSDEPRDSSATAIAACGLHELGLLTGDDHYLHQANSLTSALIASYRPTNTDADPLLEHGVYHRLAGMGVDEGNLWGDYFFLEALVRLTKPSWTPWWWPMQDRKDDRGF